MLTKSTLLLYYKRKDIREEITRACKDLEVATRFDFGFGKRPDMIGYPDEVLDLAKKGSTSFHFSEERWANPLLLSPKLKKKDLEDLRIGWDLVIDIDCPYWEFSKLSAKLILQALYDNGVEKSVSIKFSGNKGFHIGVPFDSFPKEINGLKTEKLFPDAARIVALYIIDYIQNKYKFDENGVIYFEGVKYTISEMEKKTGLKYEDFIRSVCDKCGKPSRKSNEKIIFVCPVCGNSHESNLEFFMCEKCNVMCEKHTIKQRLKDDNLCNCENSLVIDKFNIMSILDVDTILISSRHLYRSVYSLHEKSGLVSAPFNPKKIDAFKKDFCKPEKVKISNFKFLDRENAIKDECVELFDKAYHLHEKTLSKKVKADNKYQFTPKEFDDEELAEEIPEELFPPCITCGLEGMEDGKKRFMFALTNFLSMTGYNYDRIEEILIDWNKKQPEEALRDTILLGQVRYAKQHNKRILPPNCDNNMYYKDLGICKPDNLCPKIKNPVNYSRRKARFLMKKAKKKEKPQNQ
ncbi:hypothetical protein C0585_00550 [Candidatus Woesearchaeota archaeon]|nr:MAG: hypothetical protein C0585_00550 [Candidatus Woesearchaeota archaeon]